MITALTDELEDLERELALELEGLELDNDVQVDEGRQSFSCLLHVFFSASVSRFMVFYTPQTVFLLLLAGIPRHVSAQFPIDVFFIFTLLREA